MKQLPWPEEQKAREARHKALLFLRNECGYSWKQISRAMNRKRGECENAYYRAKHLLRTKLVTEITAPVVAQLQADFPAMAANPKSQIRVPKSKAGAPGGRGPTTARNVPSA